MSEPSSRSMEQARELLHGRVFEEAQIAVALALDAARAEQDAEWREWLYSSDPAGTPAFRALKEAVADERERCARIVESFHDDGSMDWCGFNSAPIAELIRKSEERTHE